MIDALVAAGADSCILDKVRLKINLIALIIKLQNCIVYSVAIYCLYLQKGITPFHAATQLKDSTFADQVIPARNYAILFTHFVSFCVPVPNCFKLIFLLFF